MKEHEYFMQMALQEAETALRTGDFPVGCVLVKDGVPVVRAHRLNSHGARANELDHAEITALRQLLRDQPDVNCSKITAYSTMEPCLMCYSTLLLSGIRTFVWAYEDIMGGGTALSLKQLPSLYADMQIEMTPRVLRGDSLDLFQQFFRRFDYWRDSPLAAYTLAQEPEKKQ